MFEVRDPQVKLPLLFNTQIQIFILRNTLAQVIVMDIQQCFFMNKNKSRLCNIIFNIVLKDGYFSNIDAFSAYIRSFMTNSS
jgi:hypothetical protein